MKKLLCILMTMTSLSGAAIAADLPNAKTPLVAQLPTFTWTGFYVGLHGGGMYQGGDLNLASTGDTPLDAALNPHLGGTSFIGGALLGYNYQMGATVIGLEGDIGFGNAHSTVVSAKSNVALDVWYADNKLVEHINGHVRSRLGWANGPLLVYGAVGLALSDGKVDVVGYCPPDIYYAHGSHQLIGLSLGAGVEYALTNNIILRGEYMYDDYGHRSVDVGSGPPNYWQNREVKLQNQTVRLAVSYKF